jgi:hypothetical protein
LEKGGLVMHRLIEKGLMFGNLIRVDSPVQIDRYNRALRHLTGKTTALTEFHIDMSGYSPEVGDELGDDLYLNREGGEPSVHPADDRSENRAPPERKIFDLARDFAAVHRHEPTPAFRAHRPRRCGG